MSRQNSRWVGEEVGLPRLGSSRNTFCVYQGVLFAFFFYLIWDAVYFGGERWYLWRLNGELLLSLAGGYLWAWVVWKFILKRGSADLGKTS